MKRRVMEYTAVFEEETEGGYSVWIPTLPGCASQGETLGEAINNIQEAIQLYLADSTRSVREEEYDFKRQFVVPVRIYA